ncbi:hypothetical protein ACNAN0_02560 [Agrilactobacillus fermenti]|uniref:hypothetical protein n=1 Tax=Agrilactobacillus fermenti TaxID=2586909 RepID=UPI001E356FC4|nr:hypothetical protein [Agrilactobacillus fermenti]MCD2256402.1 hypothetical protein [Agrilactobacillus fermenti]
MNSLWAGGQKIFSKAIPGGLTQLHIKYPNRMYFFTVSKDGYVYIYDDKQILSLYDPRGQKKWSKNVPGDGDFYWSGSSSNFFTTDENNLGYISYYGYYDCYDKTNGNRIVHKKMPAIDTRTIFFSTSNRSEDGYIYVISTTNPYGGIDTILKMNSKGDIVSRIHSDILVSEIDYDFQIKNNLITVQGKKGIVNVFSIINGKKIGTITPEGANTFAEQMALTNKGTIIQTANSWSKGYVTEYSKDGKVLQHLKQVGKKGEIVMSLLVDNEDNIIAWVDKAIGKYNQDFKKMWEWNAGITDWGSHANFTTDKVGNIYYCDDAGSVFKISA